MKTPDDFLGACVSVLREKNPLVHHITNYVTANDCANIVLAAGGSPVMADDEGECVEITVHAAALAINIGTLNERTVLSMLKSGGCANELGIPVIFDPVGVGASPMRGRAAERLLSEVRFAVVRGNASEIFHIAYGKSGTKGVDVGEGERASSLEALEDAAQVVATRFGCVVAVTGAVDVVLGGAGVCHIANGHPEMGRITGSGCMCTSLIASFLGAGLDPFAAAVSGVALMGVAGELAFERCGERGTGSFRTGIVDAVSCMTDDELAGRATISWTKRA